MSNVKEKVNKLDAIIADLKNIQLWHLENKRNKNQYIKQHIEYASCVREWLLNGEVRSHLGRLGGTYKFKNGVICYYLIEDTDNKATRAFVRKINMLAFDDCLSRDAFRIDSFRVSGNK